jgi:hypothetical protein
MAHYNAIGRELRRAAEAPGVATRKSGAFVERHGGLAIYWDSGYKVEGDPDGNFRTIAAARALIDQRQNKY